MARRGGEGVSIGGDLVLIYYQHITKESQQAQLRRKERVKRVADRKVTSKTESGKRLHATEKLTRKTSQLGGKAAVACHGSKLRRPVSPPGVYHLGQVNILVRQSTMHLKGVKQGED